ncbi:DMT family transporter [Limosilactobacillus fermentum]|uniref:EamA family transporter n=1 Tax=Limosilactobacillus fermentum TaxID=1613 RepID=A0A843R179_LIMFE|nr:DMT family transporter [Limosilactobacillus fermentum]MPQ35778.1 EamA family transporter [Limosilactobacillus fermentum]
MTKKSKGLWMAIIGASFWGGSGAAAQYLFANTSMTAIWLVTVRLLFGGGIMLLIGLARHRDQIKAILSNKRDIAILVIFAFLGNFNSQLTYMLAVQASNASTATVIQYLSPVLIILWLAFRNREWPRRIDVISIIFALVGTFLLVTGGRLDALTITPNALMWGSSAALAASIYTLAPRSLLARYDTITVCGMAMFLGGLCISPNLFLTPVPHFTGLEWLDLIYIVVFGTMMAYTFFLGSVKYISPALTGMLSAFEPLVATFLTVTLLGTKLTSITLLGSFLIIFGILIESIPFKRIKMALH